MCEYIEQQNRMDKCALQRKVLCLITITSSRETLSGISVRLYFLPTQLLDSFWSRSEHLEIVRVTQLLCLPQDLRRGQEQVEEAYLGI